MKSMIDILPWVQMHLAGATADIVQITANEVWRDFCHETQCWRLELDPIPVVAGLQEYELNGEFPNNARLDCITKVELYTREIFPGSGYTFESGNILKLTDEPSTADSVGLVVEIAMRPKNDATTICPEIYDDYFQGAVEGILAKMFAMEKKPWSSPEAAVFRTRQYELQRTAAKIRVNRLKMNSVLRAAPSAPWA